MPTIKVVLLVAALAGADTKKAPTSAIVVIIARVIFGFNFIIPPVVVIWIVDRTDPASKYSVAILLRRGFMVKYRLGSKELFCYNKKL
jgi:hypothetical protein